jgi:hypothetical protein
MAPKKVDRRLFEHDRRMELKLRLAAKRALEPVRGDMALPELGALPEREVVDRLIEKVRRL